MVDLDWGNTSLFVDEIMENHVAAKLFADKVVLCISPDYVPGKQTNRKVHPYVCDRTAELC